MKKILTSSFFLLLFFAFAIVADAQDFNSDESSGFWSDAAPYIKWGSIVIGIGVFMFTAFFIVGEKDVAIIERLGKFHSIKGSGLRMKIPILDSVVDRLSLQVDELEVEVETKTKDDVFVKTKVSVQRQILKDKVYQAYYELDDSDQQMSSYIFDTVRAEVPKLTLDELFEKKDEIANAVQQSLRDTMDDFGFVIKKALITDIDPAEEVKDAMNKINASKRLMEATKNSAEAEKISMVKKAEAEADSKKLQGEGIANQRKAIAAGLKEAAEDLKDSLGNGATADQVMQLLLTTQYFDALRDIAANDKTNTIFLPHSPNGIASIGEQLLHSNLMAGAAKNGEGVKN